MTPEILKQDAPTQERTSSVSTHPLTTALLEFSARAISFQTPGHRGGRSCRTTTLVGSGAGESRVT
jgi:arginine/lysine/ornithine decarboxylase